MIDWVNELGKDWGRYLRKSPNGYPKISVSGRIREEGSVGAAIRCHLQIIPIQDMPKDILEFHRAWSVIESSLKRLLYVHYGSVAKVDEKLEFLGLNRSTYYARLDRAQRVLWETIDLQSKVQKVQPVQN